MILKLMLLMFGGAAGTVCRFGMSELAHALLGRNFPWGTLAVNVIGCLLFGLIFAVAEHRMDLGPHARLFVLTGFMGAFTTFSTFGFESVSLHMNGDSFKAFANIAAQNVLGMAAAFAGLAIGRLI